MKYSDEEQRYKIRQLCLSKPWGLYYFNAFIINPTIPDDERLSLKPFHKQVLDFADDDTIPRKGIKEPRYFLKSSLITQAKPILDYIRNPNERILIGAETHTKAELFLYAVAQQLEGNEILHYYFPETKTTPRWRQEHRWSSQAIDMPRDGKFKEPTIMCIGVGGAAQGLHMTRIYLDDIIGKKAMKSPVIRHDTKIWYNNTEELLVQPDPTKRNPSFLYLIGTNYAPGDIYEQVKAEDSRYQWIRIQAEVNGIPTWPERLGAEEIAKMKAERPMVWFAQMQNDPQSSELVDFQGDWLQYYEPCVVEDKPAIKFEDRLGREVYALIQDLDIKATIDPAFSESGISKTSRTAIVIVGVHKKTNLKFILEAWAKRITEPRHLYKQVMEFHLKYRPKRWGCEAFQAQAFILKGIREYFMDKKIVIPITALDRDVGKDAKELRIRSMIDEFGTGQVYSLKTMRDFEGEFKGFPICETWDIMDALAYHKKWWTNVDFAARLKDNIKRKSNFIMSMGNSRTGYG